MRFILAFALLLGALSAVVWKYPDLLPQGLHAVSDRAERLLNDKEIEIEGLSVLTRADILKDLPLHETILWWKTHGREVEVSLERNPLIQDATVMSCAEKSLNCFDIQIKEREPAYIVNLGDRVWLLGADGGFITPVPKKEFLLKGAGIVHARVAPVIVEGLLEESASPDVVKGRIAYVRSVIEVVEPETGLKVRAIEVRSNGEASLRFHGYDLRAVFDAGAEHLDRVREEARRLKTVLDNFGDQATRIAQVDLAFDKVAVTTLNEAKS